jgi:hypothetical protein
MYALDAGRAVAEATRVVRPGGRIAFMVWGPEANNSVVFHGARAANAFLGGIMPEQGFVTPTRFAEPGLLSELMSSAGMQDAREQKLIFEPRINVGLPFWAPLLEMNSTHIWTGLTADVQKQVHQAVAQAYEAFRDGDSYKLKTHCASPRPGGRRRPQAQPHCAGEGPEEGLRLAPHHRGVHHQTATVEPCTGSLPIRVQHRRTEARC